MIHIMIHRRSNNFFARTRHNSSSKHIICNAVCNLPDYVGACRCNHNHICLFCNGNMLNAILKITVKRVYKTLIVCQCFKGERIYKIFCIFSHQDVYVTAHFHYHTCKVGSLICRNRACYTQYNSFSFKHRHQSFLTHLPVIPHGRISPLA